MHVARGNQGVGAIEGAAHARHQEERDVRNLEAHPGAGEEEVGAMAEGNEAWTMQEGKPGGKPRAPRCGSPAAL